MRHKKWISGYYYIFLIPDSVNFYKRKVLVRISFLVPANDVDSAHYYSRFVCLRVEGIFLTFIQILYLIIIRPRVRRATALVAVTICAAVKANFSSSSASFIVLFFMFVDIFLSREFFFALWITFLSYFSFIIFSLYEHRAYSNTHLLSSRLPFESFNSSKYVPCKVWTSFFLQ